MKMATRGAAPFLDTQTILLDAGLQSDRTPRQVARNAPLQVLPAAQDVGHAVVCAHEQACVPIDETQVPHLPSRDTASADDELRLRCASASSSSAAESAISAYGSAMSDARRAPAERLQFEQSH